MNRSEKTKFNTAYIFTEYEDGTPVSEIARVMGKSESYVYATMKLKPEKYEDVKKIREEKYNRRLRRIRGLCDRHVEEFLEGLDADKAAERIETVNRIAKDYANRVLLAEGKNTENIGLGGAPLTMIVRKTYPDKEAAENACDD